MSLPVNPYIAGNPVGDRHAFIGLDEFGILKGGAEELIKAAAKG